ncbi:MAG: sigma-70 family RNA polymerase sigma factor [Kiritimatiellae bacterium]|nr:sigma-70 family RNA polymerase sigma factor [Kiritimatiellia bacterium]
MPGDDRVNEQIESCIKRVLAGETEAYGEIVDAYQQELWRLIVWFVHDRVLAEDVVQSAFVRAFFALDQYESGRDFGAWLKTIAKNEARMMLRKLASRARTADQYADQVRAASALRQVENDALSVEKMYLEQCLEQVPAPLRRLLEAYYKLGQSVAQMAEQTRRSVAAIKKALSRTRLRLRQCIERKAAGHGG